MSENPLRHAMSRMGGRDPAEEHRASTPLELFFDLTFAIAFGVAAGQLASGVAAGQTGPALIGFAFGMFAVMWAWINFSWFASAYDTDDWVFRLVTLVQMTGVLILAMGLEPMFTSIEEGRHVDNRVMVLGYVVMRLALVFQWLRAAKQDPERRRTCLDYARYLALAQVGWVVLIIINTSVPVMFLIAAPLFLLEMATPLIAERNATTPWHAHHIAERYSLLAIIALGECLVGTIDALRAVVATGGWTPDTAFVGLRIYAAYLQGQAHIGEAGVAASVAIPVAVFAVTLTFLYSYMVEVSPLHVWLAAGMLVLCGAAVALALAGAGVSLSLSSP